LVNNLCKKFNYGSISHKVSGSISHKVRGNYKVYCQNFEYHIYLGQKDGCRLSATDPNQLQKPDLTELEGEAMIGAATVAMISAMN
jgi:hypothetical protein